MAIDWSYKNNQSINQSEEPLHGMRERPFGDDEVQVSFLEIVLGLGGELRDDASLFLGSRGEITDGVFDHEICGVSDRHVSIESRQRCEISNEIR